MFVQTLHARDVNTIIKNPTPPLHFFPMTLYMMPIHIKACMYRSLSRDIICTQRQANKIAHSQILGPKDLLHSAPSLSCRQVKVTFGPHSFQFSNFIPIACKMPFWPIAPYISQPRPLTLGCHVYHCQQGKTTFENGQTLLAF